MGTEQTTSDFPALTIYIEGDDVRPETVNADEWIDLVREYQSALEEISTFMTGDKPDGVFYALVGVRDNCIAVDLRVDDKAWQGAQLAAKAVEAEDYGGIPASAMKSLERIASRVHKKQRTFSVSGAQPGGVETKIIELHDPKQLPAEPPVIKTSGDWSFAGRCTRINLENGTATIRLANQETTRVSIEGLTANQAEELGEVINKLVEFEGIATWRKPEWELASFRLRDMRRLPENPAGLFEELAELSNGRLNEYDADDIQQELRGGREE